MRAISRLASERLPSSSQPTAAVTAGVRLVTDGSSTPATGSRGRSQLRAGLAIAVGVLTPFEARMALGLIDMRLRTFAGGGNAGAGQ